MKKIYLTGILLMFVSFVNAQITLLNYDDSSVIENESVFTYNSVDEASAMLKYRIQNNTSSPIEVQASIVEIEGSDGSNVQFCIGDCRYNITVGSIVPIGWGFPIVSNGTTGPGIYFWNKNNTSDYIRYKFKVFQVDSSFNEVGTPIYVTYIYNANASTPNMALQKLGVKIDNTLVGNSFSFTSDNQTTAEIFDINGKSISVQNFAEGNNVYDASALSKGIYIVKFTDLQGKTASVKIAKQ